MAYQGRFKPKNPSKYMGDPTNIIYRSGWELKLMSFLDVQDNVIRWSSEEVVIPYRSPIDGKRHRYFPDFYVEQINTNNKIDKILIEVKPITMTLGSAQFSQLFRERLINGFCCADVAA